MKINNVVVKSPSEMSIEQFYIEEEYLNALGETLTDYVATKRKITCVWAYLTFKEGKTLLAQFKNRYVDITYTDTELGEVTKTFKVGNKPSTIYNNKLERYKDIKIDFNEK